MANAPLVLIVDDEPSILRLLELELTEQGFRVVQARNGDEGLKLAIEQRPDIIVADIVMPGATGLELMRRVRESMAIPFVLLTARGRDQDKVQGLELGADDYVAKPFNPAELTARVRAVLRRGAREEGGNVIEIDGLKIDLDLRLVSRDGQVIALTGTEWRLLEQLANNPGRVMLSRELLSRVWSDDFRDDLQYLRGWISSLRKKIEADPHTPRVIKTFPGVGYLLDVNGDVRTPDAAEAPEDVVDAEAPA